MRGVYQRVQVQDDHGSGSSPHARGLLVGRVAGQAAGWIIPACAGFTLAAGDDEWLVADHPRMRGVYIRFSNCRIAVFGSSPHARGLPVRVGDPGHEGGIIPACAGFTRRCGGSCRGWRDHPRMRGVYARGLSWAVTVLGSSPHARGLPVGLDPVVHVPRIIPACAGFTPS